MRFDGARENLDPSQVSVVDEELRWVDESGKEHRVPLVEDIVRHSKRVLSSENRKTIQIRDSVSDGNVSSDFHILEVGRDQLIRIEAITLVSSFGGETGPQNFDAPEGSGLVLVEFDEVNEEFDLVEILVELDSPTTMVDGRSVEVDVSSGIYFILVDYAFYIDADPQTSGFNAYCSFNVWVEDE